MAGQEIVVLGGGFAGLSCATALAEAGAKVTLLEKKPHLGGRAYSFKDSHFGEVVDNGQHLFMGCYRQTRAFLRRIGTESLLNFPPGLRVDYVDERGARDALRCPSFLPAPMHLAWGILRLSGLSIKDKLGLWRFDRTMKRQILNGSAPPELDRVTVGQWLASMGLSERMQSRLFDPIAIGALNEHSGLASALGFSQVLKEIFYGGEESSRLGLATVGLSELYTEQAKAYIESRGGRVLLGRKASAIIEEKGRAKGVRTDLGENYPAGAVVSTLPPWALAAVQRPKALGGDWTSWRSTPIIGIHVWLNRPIFTEPFIGLLGTEIHWAFNKTALWRKNGRQDTLTPALSRFREREKRTPLPPKGGEEKGEGEGQYLSLVISGAHRYLDCSPQKIWGLANDEMSRCFPKFAGAQVKAWTVIKEPHATPTPFCGSDALRPAHRSPIANFFYAGDWTQTGLPATIESATASGHACAELALNI